MLRPTYPITTARLLLRPYAETDFPFLCDMYARPEVVRFLYEEPRPAPEVRKWLDARIGNVAIDKEGDYLSLVIASKDAPETLIGNAMLRWISATHGSGELGYTIHPDHKGNGYATEAAKAILDLGFGQTKLHRIIGRLDGRNIASHRILQKIGMRTEAHLVENEWIKGEWTDEIICALLRSEWEQTQLLD
ncbi:MAG TPA: GNAT family N-acetyltransferase [Pseudonocardiaceae bacterium]|jgi:RimJ/RimL family protein N-acetyltransferase|nr:GNAT family N-acetyltransferase [Pseudonocardiaceae bacterium]